MSSATRSILRRATRSANGPWNILTFPTHERYETSLAATGHNFYAIRVEGGKDWKTHYAPVPANYQLLPITRSGLSLPPWVDFDMVLSQNKASQFRIAQDIAHQLHIPLVNLEHTLPQQEWTPGRIASFQHMQGSINVFVSEYQKQMWGLDGIVNPTGIDTDVFCPPDTPNREPWALSVVNDWINRDWCCGFSLWKEVTGFPSPAPLIPCRVLGDTPGLSQPAPDIPTLVRFYQTAGVYLNTTLVSSLPTVILEAMSCIPKHQDIFYDYMITTMEELVNLPLLNKYTKSTHILNTHERIYTGNLIKIKTNHIPDVEVTEEHPVEVVNITEKYDKTLVGSGHKPLRKIIGTKYFKSASQLQIKEDWLVIPKLKIEKELPSNISNDWMRFYGLFLAEGSIAGNQIQFTFHQKEQHLVEFINKMAKLLDRKPSIYNSKTTKAVRLTISHGVMARNMLNMFHRYSHNKNIPKELMEAPKDKVKSLIDGYIEGDGHIDKRGCTLFRTVSKNLAYQLILLLTKLDILPNICTMKPKKGSIRGRTFYGKKQYLVSFIRKHPKSKKLYLEDNDCFYVRVLNTASQPYNDIVYNLTTETGVFTIPFIEVHNCGTPVVSTDTCLIPKNIIEHGVNGFVGSSVDELRHYTLEVLNNPTLARQIGDAGRQTIVEKFSKQRFIENWNEIFKQATEIHV